MLVSVTLPGTPAAFDRAAYVRAGASRFTHNPSRGTVSFEWEPPAEVVRLVRLLRGEIEGLEVGR